MDMEKVKITIEQEVALNEWKDCGFSFINFAESTGRGEWHDDFKPLNDVTISDFSLMLNGWYEVEEFFKVGDWVIWGLNDAMEYLKITKITSMGYGFHDDSVGSTRESKKYKMEKIEEPWKIMLLDLGREKPEFVRGDSYLTETTYRVINNVNNSMHTNAFVNNEVIEFFPKSDGIKIQGGN